MSKFRKRPVVVEAMYYNGDNLGDIKSALSIPEEVVGYDAAYDQPLIKTLEGDHRICDGDWIIKGIAGEFYPCKDAIFEATYEPVID